MGDLDRCPFCGGTRVTYEHRVSKYDHGYWLKVMCWDCGCQTKEFKAVSPDREGIMAVAQLVTDRWNKRYIR